MGTEHWNPMRSWVSICDRLPLVYSVFSILSGASAFYYNHAHAQCTVCQQCVVSAGLVSKHTVRAFSTTELGDQVAKLLALFDTDHSGVFDQAQFALVLGQSPYLRLLPPQLQCRTPGIMSQVHRKLKANTCQSEPFAALPVADEFIRY